MNDGRRIIAIVAVVVLACASCSFVTNASVGNTWHQGTRASYAFMAGLSSDGRYVFFESDAVNLGPGAGDPGEGRRGGAVALRAGLPVL